MTSLKDDTDQLVEQAVAEINGHLKSHGERVHTDLLRKQANKIDGIRFARSLLESEQLLNISAADDLRAASRTLGIAFATGVCAQQEGFSQGVSAVRGAVVKRLESLLAGNPAA
jgi:hypothetical protein